MASGQREAIPMSNMNESANETTIGGGNDMTEGSLLIFIYKLYFPLYFKWFIYESLMYKYLESFTYMKFYMKVYMWVFSAIMDAVRPAVHKLDEQVKNTRKSQLHLLAQMDELSQCELYFYIPNNFNRF